MKSFNHIKAAFAGLIRNTHILRAAALILVPIPGLLLDVTALPICAVQETGREEGCGLAPEAYSYDGGLTWSSEPSFTAQENGNYEVLVRDKLGNQASCEITIDKIDRRMPEADYTLTPDTFTKDNVAVTLRASDDASGLGEDAYSFDGGLTWGKEPAFLLTENGTVDAAVRDRAGNVLRLEIPVVCIDRQAPDIRFRLEPEEWYEGSAVLTVVAEDTGAGLDIKPYSWDQGQTYQAAAGKVISGPGEYRVLVRDALGNCGYGIYYAAYRQRPQESAADTENDGTQNGGIDTVTPAETVEDETMSSAEVSDTESMTDSSGKEEAGNRTGADDGKENGTNVKEDGPLLSRLMDILLSDENETGENSGNLAGLQPEQGEYIEPVRLAGPDAADTAGFLDSLLAAPAVVVVLTLTMLAAVIAGTGSGLYLMLMSAGVFNYDGEKHYRLIGVCLIRRKEDYYTIRLSRSMEERCITGQFRICPGPGFVLMNHGGEFVVEDASGDKAAVMLVDRRMECNCRLRDR